MGNKTPTEDGETRSINQHHEGIGDNVSGNKIVNQGITPKALLKPIQDTLTKLRHRKLNKAKEHLSALATASNLDADAVGILNITKLLVDLAEDNLPSDGYQQASTYLSTTDDPFFRDIAISAQIRLDVKNEKFSDARSRYHALDIQKEYSREAYYEFIADYNEIEDTFKSQKLQLTEPELCGLVRGALRLKFLAEALAIAEHLHSISPSFNSKVLIVVLKANTFDAANNHKHYWSINASSHLELLRLCDDVVNLLNECNGNDFRLCRLSASLLDFVLAGYKPLADACWNYISEIDAQLPEVAVKIRNIYEMHPDNIDDALYKLVKAKEDPLFRKEVITEITKSVNISAEESVLLSSIGDKKSIQKWIGSGGSISSTNELERDFSVLELKALACDDNPKTVDELRSLANKFIDDFRSKLTDLNPPLLLGLADKLVDAGASSQACELLKPHVPTNDIWASPIVRCYLNALLASQQMMTLSITLAEINQNEWDSYIWQIKARQLEHLHKYEEAIDAIEESLKITQLSHYAWHLLIYLHKKNESENERIIQALNRIPDDVFSQPSDLGYQLLAETALAGDFVKAESFLICWFINNPDSCAIPFSNFVLSLSLFRDKEDVTNPSPAVGDCVGGVTYTSDGKVTTKLLVADDVAPHQSLLSISSPLGNLLSEMIVGDIKQHSMQDIKLIERLPPYLAAFNIASTLRQAINDGSDCFHSFQLPEDPSEMFKSLERKLGSSDSDKNDLYAQPNIPLFMKGVHYNKHDPVKSALYHLTEKASVKQALPAFGEEAAERIILDVYSASYLALTGLVYGLQDSQVNIVITIETKRYIEQWLEDINREDYLSIGVHPDGGLWRNTAEDIRQQTADIQEAFNLILAKSEVVSPNLVDIPPEVLRIEDAVDLSVLSSLKLSITNDISWLCIDLAFAQLSQNSNYTIVNANQFFTHLGTRLHIEQKQKGIYLHVSAGLPYPLTYEEIIKLSNCKEGHAQYFLAELLKMYPTVFTNSDTAIQFLHKILVHVLVNAYHDGEVFNGLRVSNARNTGYVERIFNASCYISMQIDDGEEAEHKIAMLLASLLHAFREVQSVNKLILQLASVFITGHFMNFSAVNRHLKERLIKLSKDDIA